MSAKKDASRRNIAAMARELAPLAMKTIEGLLTSDDERVKLSAAEHVLDRAIGKPIAMTADVTDRLDELTDDELDAALASVTRQVEAAAEKARAEEATPAVTH